MKLFLLLAHLETTQSFTAYFKTTWIIMDNLHQLPKVEHNKNINFP